MGIQNQELARDLRGFLARRLNLREVALGALRVVGRIPAQVRKSANHGQLVVDVLDNGSHASFSCFLGKEIFVARA